MKGNLHHARLLGLFALATVELSFLLSLAPSLHANPAPPRVHPDAVDSSAANALLQFASQGHVLGFRVGEFYVSNATYALRVEFVDANPVAPTSDTAAESQSEQRSAPPLSRVTYANLWEGITLAYDAARGGVVSSSYRVEAGADPRSIRLRYNAPVMIHSDGTLTIAYATGEMIESAPVAWQMVESERVPVTVAFAQRGEREIGFALGAYDDGQPLFIDPTLTWTTFLGGGGDDFGYAIAVDGSGNVYVAGASNAAWGVPVRAYTGGYDAFAAKLNSSGALVWNTFLGGSGNDHGNAIAIDASGNVYVAGYSQAAWGSPVRAFGGAPDAFAAKLSSSGVLTWNTFLGGGGVDYGNAVAVDGSGFVYVAGASDATWGAPVRVYTSGYDAFAAKLSLTGGLMWNTFLGGSGGDYGYAMVVDASGNVYVAGNSDATWGSPVRAFGVGPDAFAAKLSPSAILAWNTFLGGSGYDSGGGIAVDASGNVYVSGASSATWQGTSPPVRAYTGSYDAFAAKLGSGGTVIWSTFLGGGGPDYGSAIRVDGSGNVYVAGFSYATWQAASPPVRAYSGAYDTFAVKLNSGGGVTWNTFLGGSGQDYGDAIAVDNGGNVYVAGESDAAWGSPVHAYTAQVDAFAAKMSSSGALTWNTFFGGIAYDYGNAIAIDASGNIYVAGSSNTRWGSPVRDYTSGYDAYTAYDAYAAKLNSSGGLVWNSFLGGSGRDDGWGIAVDASGNVYVSGYSGATWGSPVRGYTSGNDGFAAKLNSSGALAWNTFLGGNGNDYGNAIAVDGTGNVYVVGASTNGWGSPVRPYTLNMDTYVAKLTPSGTLGWNSFLGGIGWDTGAAVAVDSIGNTYVAGGSDATWQGLNLPVRAYTSGGDAYAAKVNPGGAVVWNSFLGGTGRDVGSAIALDSGGSLYVAGYSEAAWGSPVRGYTSGYDAFAAKLNSGGALLWNSFLGGSGNEFGLGVGVDGSGNVYVAGYGTATWGSPVRGYTSADDGFAAKMTSTGAIKWNTFLGGSGNDYGNAIAVDGRGNVYVAGDSGAAWQGAGAPIRAYMSGTDAFVAMIGAFDGYLPLIRK